jgi:hypothetical protein
MLPDNTIQTTDSSAPTPSTGSAIGPTASSLMGRVIALKSHFPNHQKRGLRKEVKWTKTEASPRPQIGRFQVAPLPRSWVASLGRSVTRVLIRIAEPRNDAPGEIVLMDQKRGHMGGPKKFLFVSYEGFIGDIAWILTKEGHQVKYFIESIANRDIADGFVEKSEDWQADAESG